MPSNIAIDLGVDYAGGIASFTALTPQGYTGGLQQGSVYSVILNASGVAAVTTLGSGQQYRVMVCKSDGSVCLLGTVNVTGQAQDISATLEAYEIGSGGGGVTLNSVTVTVTSAELLALEATPVTLLAAPAANKTNLIQYILLAYNFVTTPYTIANADNALTIGYVGTSFATEDYTAAANATDLLDQSANTAASGGSNRLAILSPKLPFTVQDNAIELSLGGTTPNLTLGDGTLDVTLYYVVADL